MRSRAPRICAEPGCATLTTTPRCSHHTPKPWATSRRHDQLPPDWQSIRRRVLERDDHACRVCGAPATDVDHIDDLSDHRETNLQALCEAHHRVKTLAEATAGRARTRNSER